MALMNRLGRRHLCAATYVAVVAVCATANVTGGGENWWWYGASMILTLPLSFFALYPIMFLSGAASEVTGGDYVAGNAFGAAVFVCAFVVLAVVNVALCWAVVSMVCARREPNRVSTQLPEHAAIGSVLTRRCQW